MTFRSIYVFGEFMSKFDVIIERVVASREKAPIDNEDMWNGAANAAVSKIDIPSFECRSS